MANVNSRSNVVRSLGRASLFTGAILFTPCAHATALPEPTGRDVAGPAVRDHSVKEQTAAPPPEGEVVTVETDEQRRASKLAEQKDATKAARERRVLVDNVLSSAELDQEETAHGNLDQIHAQYRLVRKLFGGEHAVLTAVAFGGRRCSTADGSAHSIFGQSGCLTETRAGVAGIVMVPLLGVGGGHRATFWPVVQTDDEVQSFLRFQHSVSLHADALDATWAVYGANEDALDLKAAKDLAARAVAFRESLKELLNREIATKGAHADLAEKFLKCLAQLEEAHLLAALEWDRLVHLWQEYVGIIGSGDAITRRPNLLLGPFIGAPVTEDPRKLALYGAAAEIGGQGFRVTLGGGLTADYSATFVPATGWFAMLGLSGEWGDDLLHYLSGARDAAAGLKAKVALDP
jgi:hypothetical protein